MRNIFFLIPFLISEILFAQDSTYNMTKIGGYVWQSDMATLSSGEVVVVGVMGYNIYYQLIDTLGNLKGDPEIVNDFRENRQEKPVVCSLMDGGFAICWEKNGGPYEGEEGISAKVFDQSGIPISEEFAINNSATGWSLHTPRATSITENKFVVCWTLVDYNHEGSVYARIFYNNGTPARGQFRVIKPNYPSILDESSVSVISYKSHFVVGWVTSSNFVRKIHYKQYNSFGNTIRYTTYLTSTSGGTRRGPNGNKSFFGDSNSLGFLLAFIDGADQEDQRVFIQQFDLAGNSLFPKTQISTNSVRFNHTPVIGKLNNSKYIIVWNQNNKGVYASPCDIYAQILNNDLSPNGPNFRVNDKGYEGQSVTTPNVTPLGKSKLIVSYDTPDRVTYYKYYFQEPLRHNLEQFKLLSPENEERLSSNYPALVWSHSSDKRKNFPWEITYSVYLDKDANFSNPDIFTGIQELYYWPDALSLDTKYYWKVLAESFNGDSVWNSEGASFYINPVVSIKNNSGNNPIEYDLSQNYPNPFNPYTKISYSIQKAENVNVSIFNLNGERIITLIDEFQNAGYYTIDFNSAGLSSGIYFYRIITKNYSESKKMILLR